MSNKKFSSKKLKYGTSAVIFTVVFVVFIILVNVLLSYVDRTSGGLYVDMTSKQLYGVSQQSVEALSTVEKPVEIIFCAPHHPDLYFPVYPHGGAGGWLFQHRQEPVRI